VKRQLLVALALAFAAAPAFAARADAPKTPRTLTVTGTAQVTVTPDICYMSFTTTKQDKKSAIRAYQMNTDAMNAVIAAIKEQGIEMKDIQTSNLNISPQYHYDEDNSRRIFDGYLVTNTTTVSVRDLGKVSGVLDAAVTAGATEVGYVNFTVENPKRYTADARVEALNAAKAKAQKIADVAGVTLGKPLTISENEPGSYGGWFQANAQVQRDQTITGDETANLAPGQAKISHTVYITYEIE
jgi:uncharacterized protein YggE